MAEENTGRDSKAEKKQIADERKRLKQEEKQQKKEIKARAKEIAKREAAIEDEEEKGNGVSSFVVTTVIVVIWIAIFSLLIKLDVGGFGSEILTPLLKDVPVLNLILPGEHGPTETTEEGAIEGYTSLREAVDTIKSLELQLEHAQTVNNTNAEELTSLKKEIERLQEFELKQVEFQRIYDQFYQEVVYSDKAPDIEEYRKFYESMDPATAEAIYKQVLLKLEEEQEIKDYVSMYSQMKPKAAAKIFDELTKENAPMLSKILKRMDTDAAAKILAAMKAANAANLAKIM
jgi:flagellar motility protein MotE (MotC chaperone)